MRAEAARLVAPSRRLWDCKEGSRCHNRARNLLAELMSSEDGQATY